MQTVTLLTLVIITGFLLKKEKSPYSRIIIGSVFGVIFFSVWPLTVFYSEIHKLNENHIVFLYGIFSILAITISLFLTRIKQKSHLAIFALFFFLSTTIFTMTFESEIKNKIAIYTGFFETINPASHKQKNAGAIRQRKLLSKYNYTITMNNSWQKKTDIGPHYEYFILHDKNNEIAEFRPKCFATGNISLPEIIKNIKHSTRVNKIQIEEYCYSPDKTTYACKAIYSNRKKQIKRIRWYSMNNKSNYGVELDFVLLKNITSTIKEIEQIIRSTKITNKSTKNYHCLGLAEWM